MHLPILPLYKHENSDIRIIYYLLVMQKWKLIAGVRDSEMGGGQMSPYWVLDKFFKILVHVLQVR